PLLGRNLCHSFIRATARPTPYFCTGGHLCIYTREQLGGYRSLALRLYRGNQYRQRIEVDHREKSRRHSSDYYRGRRYHRYSVVWDDGAGLWATAAFVFFNYRPY